MILLTLGVTIWSQVPQKVAYQGMVLHANNRPASHETIGLQLSVVRDSANGPVVYRERHSATTNANGLYSVVLGEGESDNAFTAIDWAHGSYFLKCDIDSMGGTLYLVHGANQIVSVPYALYSEGAGHSLRADLADHARFADTAQVVRNLRDSIRIIRQQMVQQVRTVTRHYDSAIAHLRDLIGVPMPIEEEPIEIINYIDSVHLGAVQNGLFTISPDRRVRGSHGNLQYNATLNQWRFAEYQYDAIGMDNSNISRNYDGWIDLFGWGTSGWNSGALSYTPFATTTGPNDYLPGNNRNNDLSGDYKNADWGVFNAIVGGGEQPGLWRTLSADEWFYLFFLRNETYRFCNARVAGHNGIIVFPDGYEHPSQIYRPNNINISNVSYATNVYSATDWMYLEQRGCLFLPAAGYRRSSTVYYYNTYGNYWTSTHGQNIITFYASATGTSTSGNLDYGSETYAGCAVRLFQDEYPDSVYEVTPEVIPATTCDSRGSLSGQFTVAAGRKVNFARGNLQYQASTHTWRFAEHQYDYIGDRDGNTTESLQRETQEEWIDLFGWGTSGWRDGISAYMPYSTSTQNESYVIADQPNNDLSGPTRQADWGVFNAISNGGGVAGIWRTLTYHEWEYLLFTRTTTYNGQPNSTYRYAKAVVNRINGLILLPDEYNHPDGVRPLAYINSNSVFTVNIYSLQDWELLEQAGCVFLPAAGYRQNTRVYDDNSLGSYWTADNRMTNMAYYLMFSRNYCTNNSQNRYYGASVRLAKDIDDYVPIPVATEPIDHSPLTITDTIGVLNGQFSISTEKTVRFSKGNLQYQASTGLWRFAEEQYTFIGNHEGNTAVALNRATNPAWIDLFGWGTSGWNSSAYVYQPYFVAMNSYYYYPGADKHNNLTGDYAHADWGVHNAISNGGNQARLWRTLTQEEWQYLISLRPASTVSGVANARFVRATVHGIFGLLLLPDQYTHPDGVPALKAINYTSTIVNSTNLYNTFSDDEWALLEQAGCVFLPAAGYQNLATSVYNPNQNGAYWSTTQLDITQSYTISFSMSAVGANNYLNRGNGGSVRLVFDPTE